MNEYCRLARAKEITARSLTELLSAAYGFDESKSKQWADKLQAVRAADLVDKLPSRPVNSRELVRMIQEITKRQDEQGLIREGTLRLNSVQDVVNQVMDIRDKKKEFLLAFFLNARHQVICKEVISIGTLTASLAHPREIFAPAIGKAAAGVILVHNHPSGDPSPSDEDGRLTKRIAQAGNILGIELLDHLIVATNGCYSFKTSGHI